MKQHSCQRKGFTLIEMLVVIAIIALLASILVPAVTGALNKGNLIKYANNARSIYLSVFATVADSAMTRSSTGAFPSPAGTYATSSEYFIDLIDDGVLPEDYAIFSLPGMESASTSSDIDGDTNPWTVVDGASNAAPSGMPFVISANVDEDALTDGSDASVATPTEVTLTDPADGGLQLEDAIIFVNIGGASGSLTGREVNWENLNPTTRENDLLAPAAGAP